MADIPFDAIGFDLDGTLVDSFRDLGVAVNHALSLGGFAPVPVETSQDLIGGGAKIMLAKAIGEQGGLPGGIEGNDFRALYKAMLRFYEDNNAVHTRPYPGALEVVSELRERGIVCAVVTNKFEVFARSILQQLDFLGPFETVIGGDSMGRNADGVYLSKPHPEPIEEARKRCGGGRFAFVGDSSYDINAARAAGVPAIACAYGYCDAPPAELGADAVIETLGELIGALESL